MSIVTLTKDNFEQEVLNTSDTVLIDFYATWCGPCKMLSPIIDEIADAAHPGVKVGKVNVDEQQELAAKYGVMSIPTVLVIKDGNVVNSSVGFKPKDAILNMIHSH